MAAPHRMPSFSHGYAFDPTYGYTWERLLAVPVPEEPADFARFWQSRYGRTVAHDPRPRVTAQRGDHPEFITHDLDYLSTGGVPIGGWLLAPGRAAPRAWWWRGTTTAAARARIRTLRAMAPPGFSPA